MRDLKATLLQQVESHLLKPAFIRLHSELKANNAGARIVAAIHDAVWIECPEEEVEQVRHLMRMIMTTAAELTIPLAVDLSWTGK